MIVFGGFFMRVIKVWKKNHIENTMGYYIKR
jgi:hypothetical protein